jgi:hypothetical protein
MAVALNHFTTLEGGGRESRATILAYPKYVHAARGDAKSPLLLADPRLLRVADGWEMGHAVHRLKVYDDGRIVYGHLGYERAVKPARLVLGQGLSADVTKALRVGRVTEVGENELLMELADGLDMRVRCWHDGLTFQTEAQLDRDMRKAASLRVEFDETETGKRVGMRLNHGYVRHEQFSDTLADEQDARALLRIAEIQERSAGKYAIGAQIADIAGWPDGRIVLNDTATFQEGVSGGGAYAGTSFFGVNLNAPTKTYHDDVQWAGKATSSNIYRACLRFDVSSLTATLDAVTTATLTLTFTAETVSTDYAVYLYKMLKAWNEPAATATPAGANEPCWNYQYYNGTAWDTAGFGEEDVDRDTDITASTTITSAANEAFNFQSESCDSLVEAWVKGSANNYGFVVAGQEDGTSRTKQWATDTNATTGYRPLLTVIYTAGGGPAAAYRTYIDQAMQRNRA